MLKINSVVISIYEYLTIYIITIIELHYLTTNEQLENIR